VSANIPPVTNNSMINNQSNIDQKPANELPIVAQTTGQSSGAAEATQTAPQEQQPESTEPRLVKLQNILNGKIYKERTARGGIKWYLGEELDEEKLAKSNTIIDDEGKHMLELTKKLGTTGHASTHKTTSTEAVTPADNVKPVESPAKASPLPMVENATNLPAKTDVVSSQIETVESHPVVPTLEENKSVLIENNTDKVQSGGEEQEKTQNNNQNTNDNIFTYNYSNAKHLDPDQPVKIEEN
jgi:hypothetical protein